MGFDSPADAAVYLQKNMDDAQPHAVAGGNAVVFSAKSPALDGGSRVNEDAAALIPFDAQSAVLVVADGLGGLRAGEQASATAIKHVKASLVEAAKCGVKIRSAILNGLEKANQAIMDLALGAATTVAAVEISGSRVRSYHVGDSVVFIVGQRGKLKFQSVAHSPVGFAIESGLIDERDAMHHADRHVVSNVVGAPSMWVEVGPSIRLAARDTIVIASDGLVDNLHTDEVIDRARKGPLTVVARRLFGDAIERMNAPRDGQPSKCDDLTLIAYRRV